MVPALKRCILIYCLTASIVPFGLDAWGRPKQKISRESRYKINFNQVKAEEFIQFLSEIAGLNFVYNPGDLNFLINLVSDEEMTVETIVSGFVQTLRIQGFSILEESGTLVIHRNPDIKELPILLEANQQSDSTVAPIVTKIYQIKNSPVATIQSLIEPFLSKTSVIESFPERKLLILSDVIQNVLSIDSLIRTIDQPETGSVNVGYDTVFFSPTELIEIATPILDSVCGGKNYSLIPQEGTQRVFIVGSQQFTEKATKIFEQIEEKASKQPSSITTGNIYLYKATNRSIQSIYGALKAIAKDSKRTDFNTQSFSKLVNESTLIAPDFILFLGEPVELKKVDTLIKTIDTPQQVKSDLTFSIVKLRYIAGKAVIDQIQSMAKDLPEDTANGDFLNALQTIRWNKDTNSIVIQGSPHTIQEISDLISKMDQQTSTTSGFTIVKLQNVSGKYVVDQLNQMASQLSETSDNQDFLTAVQNIQWNKSNNTLTIRGSPSTIQQLNDIITKLDIHTVSANQYIIYKPTHMTAQELLKSLQGIGSDLESSGTADPGLIQTIKGIKIIKNSNSIIVSGTEANVIKIKEMIATLDSSTSQPTSQISQVGTSTFLSYNPKTKSAKELLDQLQKSTGDASLDDPELQKTVKSVKIVDGTLVFNGTPENLDKISKLLESLDQRIPGVVQKSSSDKYQNYKPVYKQGPELIKDLQGYMDHISSRGVNDRGLSTTIQNLQFLNGRIIVVGTQENVDQVLKLLQEFDTPSADMTKPATSIESFDNIGFLNYKLNFHTGSDIQVALKQIGEELQLSKNAKNESLINAISSVQWIRVTNSLIATGDPQTLSKLKEILSTIDIPLKQVFIEVLVIETTAFNSTDIGLRWSGLTNYKGRFAGVGSNSPRVDATSNITTLQRVQGVSGGSKEAGASSAGVNAVNGPSPNIFDSVSAGQLGIIGDIIFHGGKSYLTLASLLTALQEEGRTTITLNQKILAQDSRMSQIFVGSNIPFTGSIITTSGISQTTNANLEYRNIGVSLNITPNIGDNGIITLEIDEEITEEENQGTANATDVNTQAVNGIRTSKTSMQTRVHVPDKAFVVLSGQIRNQKTKAKSGLPCLGGLPVIGAAFTQNTSDERNADVIIFIRPEIIQTSEQWKEVSEQQEDIYRTKNDEEAFQQSIDLVKKDY